MEHRRLVQVDATFAEADGDRDVVQVQHLGPLGQQRALREPRGAARVHEHDRIVLFGLVGHHRLARAEEVLVLHVVRHVAVSHEHDLAHVLEVGPRLLQQPREQPVGEHDLGARVVEDERQLLGGQPQVERVDDAGAEEARVPQLHVAEAVDPEDGEAVVSLDAELRAQRVGEAQDAVTVLSPRAVVIAVVEPHAVGE